MATGLINSNHDTLSATYNKVLSCSSSSSSSSDLVQPPQLAALNNSVSNVINDTAYNDDQSNGHDLNQSQNQNDTNHKRLNGSGGAEESKQPSSSTSSSTNNNKSESKPKKESSFKVEIPRISSSREIRPQRAHSPTYDEYEQSSYLFNASGSKRDLNKSITRIKSIELEEAVKKARKYAMEQSVRFALVKQQQQQQKQQLDFIKKQQALLLMCRIYVGSIFYEVKEDAVKSSFSVFGPIRSISMSWDAQTNKHKGFAFIEFETPEAAQLALEQMNGTLLGGRNIKVGRPSNMPQAQPIIDQLTEDAKNYNRIYVASIHTDISESDVQSVFESFGTIKSCSLVRDVQTGKHKGYGFIEFETSQSSQDAINALNLFDLGGQLLRVGKAITPPETVTPSNSSLLNQPFGGYPTAAPTVNPAMLSASKISELVSSNATNSFLNVGLTSTLPGTLPGSSTLAGAKSSSSNLLAATASQPKVDVSSVKVNQPSTTTQLPTSGSTSSISSQLNSIAQQVNQQMNASLSAVSAAAAAAAAAVANINNNNNNNQAAVANADSLNLTENQKKLLGMTSNDDPSASLEQQVELTLKGKEQRLILMEKLMRRKPESRVIVLKNMVGPEEVDDDLEVEITDECEKYGQVEKVIIYQEKQGEEEDAEIIVKIFVEFVDAKSVSSAINSLNGRFFAGRTVKAEAYDQNSYEAKDYSG